MPNAVIVVMISGFHCLGIIRLCSKFSVKIITYRNCYSINFHCDLQGRKINFTNSNTLVDWLVDVATDRNARYL